MTDDDAKALRDAAQKATPGRWHWWTSCSWRRLRSEISERPYTLDVAVPCVQRSDGHPDIIVSEEDRAFMEAASPAAVLRLLAEREALRAALESIVINSQPFLDYSGPGKHPISRGTFEVEGSDMDEARAALLSPLAAAREGRG
jgi:hypothetical protein